MRHAFALTLEKLRAVWPTTLKSRFGWAFFASVITVLLLVSIKPVSAELIEGGVNWLINSLAQIGLAIANLSIGLSIFFLRFFIAIASYNNYIDVDVVQLGWVMVRDVANMFFVVALLVIAFGTILGLEEYEWKKNLVKLIFAAIFINFSNLIAQLFIDVAHVFTMTFLNAISATAGGNLINMFKLDQITQMVGVNPDVNTEFNVEILAGTMVAMLFAIMAAFVMGSYVYVMMARVVSLWALIILSPLAYILGVLPKTQSYAERWWSEFTNNVIVAPIMVFFLWLAFATLGTGQILASIQEEIPDNNKIDGTKSVELFGANFADSNEPTKLSLSKVSTWENMANFLIALAFLRVGVKTTEETGVWGSDMISDAWSFGKKAATIATGVAVGQWIAGRGADTLKTGASKVVWGAPLLGGRALTNYGNMAKMQIGKLAIGANNIAKNLEDPTKKIRDLQKKRAMGDLTDDQYNEKKAEIEAKSGGMFMRGLRLIGASVIQTSGRADKKSEDWEKAVEAQKTYIEENYSTSDSAGGRAKLDWGILAHKAEEMAGAKKDQKYAEGERYILDQEEKRGGGKLTELEKTIAKAKASAEKAKDTLSAHSEVQLEEQRRDLGVYDAKAGLERTKESLKIDSDKIQEAARRRAGVYDVKNLSEEEQMNLNDQVAESRAQAYDRRGDLLRADAVRKAAAVQRLGKDKELYQNLNYKERTEQEVILAEKLAASTDPNEIAKLRRQKVALATVNINSDVESGRDGRFKALKAVNFLPEGGEINDDNRLAAELSRQLGKKINVGAEADAINEWMAMFTEEQAQAALRALSDGFKGAAMKGDMSGVGLVKEVVENGKVKFLWDSAADNSIGNTKYYADRAQKVDRVTSFGNSINRNGSQVLSGFSDRGVAAIAGLYAGKDKRAITTMERSIHASWNEAEVNSGNAASYVKALKEMKKVMAEDAFKAQLGFIEEFTKKIKANANATGITKNELDDLLKTE